MKDKAVAVAIIYVKRPLSIHRKYVSMFHGKSVLDVGTYRYSFPISNFHKERVVSDFVKVYSHSIKVDFKLNGWKKV